MLTEIKQNLSKIISKQTQLDESEVLNFLEMPKDLMKGHLALPIFPFAKKFKKNPKDWAIELAQILNSLNDPNLENVEAINGFLNFKFKSIYFQNILMNAINSKSDSLGFGEVGKGKRVVIDFSSPNVAKPMSIGHLRATVIGQAIVNLAKSQGYEVIGLNHLGDWGVQFGKLAWAYQKWGHEYDFESKPIDSLLELYVRFHSLAEKDEQLDKEGSLVFKRLEQGDKEIEKIWTYFIDISLKDYQRLWDILGVKHDLVRGESFYNDRLSKTEKIIEEKGLLEQSEGAWVVRLDEEKLPPCLIRKSDGASLYATRDLASAIYRVEDLKADLNLYVVGEDQTLHFKQVFLVLKKMGYEWANHCHHISFGMYRFSEGRMSTRKGNVIFLEDVLTKAIEIMKNLVQEKNPQMPEDQQNDIAEKVGVGAVIFNDLLNDRVKNVDFNWDRILSFDGDSGPYVQYMNVRCLSLLKKYNKEIPKDISVPLTSKSEMELIRQLMRFEDVLSGAFKSFKPHIVAGYLLEVCQAFGQFYHNCRILGEEAQVESSRISLVYATHRILEQGLSILNIKCPKVM